MTLEERVARAIYASTVDASGSVHVASWDGLPQFWRNQLIRQARAAITEIRATELDLDGAA